jgi:hypothetical protein
MRQKSLSSTPVKPGSTEQRVKRPSSVDRGVKDWSLKVTVKLPHKIGQPLGSGGGSDGSDGGGGA